MKQKIIPNRPNRFTKIVVGLPKAPTLPRPSYNKIKLLIITIVILILFTIIYFLNVFFDTYHFTFQSPIIFQSPFILEKREPMIEKVYIPTPAQPVLSPIATPTP